MKDARIVLAIIAAIMLAVWACAVWGCATVAEVEQIRQSVATIEAEVHTTVGGGGDSVTAWIYAAIAGASVLYPTIRKLKGQSVFSSGGKGA